VSLRFLLDTNVLSEPLKPEPDRRVTGWLAEHQTAVATAAPVWHELRFGCLFLPRSSRREKLERYSEMIEPALPVLPYDAGAAEWHASERARLRRAGRTASFVDGQIAAVAAVNGLAVVTLHVAHFRSFRASRSRRSCGPDAPH
jgi:tRNA(fMet)-specific endonuclease VapC